MPNYVLDFKLTEPLTLAAGPAVGNEAPTLDFITATTIRGALAASLSRAGRKDKLNAWFGSSFPRWSPGFPVLPQDTSRGLGGELCIPFPSCFLEVKGEPGFGFVNAARCEEGRPPRTVGEYRDFEKGVPDGYPDDREWLQWQEASVHWLAISERGRPICAASVPSSTHMHVALHYERQANRQGALFSRGGIEPYCEFRSYVIDPDGALGPNLLPDRLFLGKRRSAGNGAAELRYSELTEPLWPQGSRSDRLFIQLMSDTILTGSNGGFMRSLNGAIPGVEAVFTNVGSFAEEYPGWSTKWGLPRESAVVIKAGSIFTVEGAGRDAAATALADHGLGIRRGEGFGFVAVDPPWLEALHIGTYPPPDTPGSRDLWPGFSESDYEKRPDDTLALPDLAKLAETLARKPGLTRQKLRAISSYSKRVTSIDQVRDFLKKVAQRSNARDWDRVYAYLDEPLRTQCRSLRQAWFLLDAAAVSAPGGED